MSNIEHPQSYDNNWEEKANVFSRDLEQLKQSYQELQQKYERDMAEQKQQYEMKIRQTFEQYQNLLASLQSQILMVNERAQAKDRQLYETLRGNPFFSEIIPPLGYCSAKK